MSTKNIYVISIAIFFFGFILGGVTFSVFKISPVVSPQNSGIVACTQEAKLCPDGTAVGRTGPNCEFSECPTLSGSGTGGGACQSDMDCPDGFQCIDVSPVVQRGYQNLRCWGKGMPRPICLSGETPILTPDGEVLAKNVKKGMSIWTVDGLGRRTNGIVLLVGKTAAPTGHRVMHIKLSDHRELFVSPGHKVADGRTTGELRAGDTLQGALVSIAELILYTEGYTYDILPSGETGMYFADGILLQSTLHQK